MAARGIRRWWRAVRTDQAKLRRRIIRKKLRYGLWSVRLPGHWRWDGTVRRPQS